MEECKILIDIVAAHHMVLTQKATGSSGQGSSSGKQSGDGTNSQTNHPSQQVSHHVMVEPRVQESSVHSEATHAIRDIPVGELSR